MLDPQRLASLIHLGELAESKVSEVMVWYGIMNYFFRQVFTQCCLNPVKVLVVL